ncbi:hypothetical protein [Arthrobacter cupressi]|uniref:Uncharacterized protein n=1 Tax=Arthrobacter cupressi TaxID=1045773 RepID=A0A1G8P0F5_9MICC|nr:hypothetical protein [Arthrobacter cupressi]NYD76681.1 hypothetical protein [Arthrobacter cupressi]SDI85728.1 hypothetical protein SAMN05216555_10514 [Arthrobacter cupressi]
MDIQNHYYGHSAVFALYTGAKRLRHVSGLIQHGWTVSSPVTAQFGDFASWGPKRRRLSWTSSSRGWKPADPGNFFDDGTPMLDAVGAPYLYLLDAARKAGAVPARKDKTLVLPLHGTALLKVDGDHEAYAQMVKEREGSATVCLHIDDLHNDEIMAAWSNAGHEIVSAGDRRDPQFIGRILWMMSEAPRVVSNRLSTALMYASVTGADVGIYGPDFKLGANAHADPGLVMRDFWPEFYDESTPQEVLRKIAEDELGRADMRTPEELKTLLGWDSHTVVPFLEYWASGPLTKAQTVLGLKKVPEGAHATEKGLSPWHWIRHPFKHLPSPLPKLPAMAAVEPLRP